MTTQKMAVTTILLRHLVISLYPITSAQLDRLSSYLTRKKNHLLYWHFCRTELDIYSITRSFSNRVANINVKKQPSKPWVVRLNYSPLRTSRVYEKNKVVWFSNMLMGLAPTLTRRAITITGSLIWFKYNVIQSVGKISIYLCLYVIYIYIRPITINGFYRASQDFIYALNNNEQSSKDYVGESNVIWLMWALWTSYIQLNMCVPLNSAK